jgi:nucleotide-binding universal stress UspA family protein
MKIFLAVDGSPSSDNAALCLDRLTRGARHDVTVAYAAPHVPDRWERAHGPVSRMLLRAGQRMLAAVASGLRRASRRVRVRLIESSHVADALLGDCEKNGAELVVLGARGLGPLKSFILGSVSQAVSRHARSSVLIARKPPPPLRPRVIVAVDGSPAGERSVRFLAGLGLPRGSAVTLVHVVQAPYDIWAAEFGFPAVASPKSPSSLELLHEQRGRGRRLLDEYRARLVPLFKSVETVLLEGHPAGEILRWAQTRSADLVVLGRHGDSGVSRFLMGSVSHKVSAYADCSVLVVG